MIIYTCSGCVYKRVITLEQAKNLYNSHLSPKIGNQSSFDSEKLYKNYRISYTKEHNGRTYYVFDIEDSDMELYAYRCDEMCYNGVLFQTLFVDENISTAEFSFNIGDSVETIKKVYPNVVFISNPMFSQYGDCFFEYLNGNVIHSYGIKDGYIVSFGTIGLDTMKEIYYTLPD